MEKSRNPRFTGIMIFAGVWNLFIAASALFFTDIFVEVLGLQGRINGLTMGQKIFWASVGFAGIIFIVSGLNNARLRFVIAMAVPGKILAFIGSVSAVHAGQAGAGMVFIGLGDLLFAIPFVLYLRATRHLGWV